MLPVVTIGEQNFLTLREKNYFYIDKTKFIRDWWLGGDPVTLITRPRRFGKTLMLDTVKTFFSPEFAGRSDLFEGLSIWKDEQFRQIQGTIPIILLSFAKFNNNTYEGIISRIKKSLASIYGLFSSLIDLNKIPDAEKEIFTSVHSSMADDIAQDSLHYLCKFIAVQHRVKPIILLDEYDTPLQEAWLHDYWDELVNFMRGFFNATFKDNPWIERGLITGITRIAKESIFSDMNNLEVVTITSDLYDDCFGFTESEVFLAMDDYKLTSKKEVKQWYDGFAFGSQKAIYNPWSIVNYLKKKKFDSYWADTTSNSLVSELLVHSNAAVKKQIELLLNGCSITTKLHEQIVFSQLYTKKDAVWALLLACGYVKPLKADCSTKNFELTLTNHEVKLILEDKISEWFEELSNEDYTFLQALLDDDIENMNELMSDICESTFSYFDIRGSVKNERREAENFYHGFVLGLLVTLKDRYTIVSNRESGFGRYDICMYPINANDHGIVIEFKSIDTKREMTLDEACANALRQIKDKDYIKDLLAHTVPRDAIYVYGFAFQGKKVLICGGAVDSIDWRRV
ncbi:MAG: AAA family ATPase [Desulfovibrio sp.]|nr:AAA family ATPase [Desulfovibrio sp.]